MTINITLGELIDKHLFTKFCEIRGWNDWIIADGLADSDNEVTLNEKEIKELGIQILS